MTFTFDLVNAAASPKRPPCHSGNYNASIVWGPVAIDDIAHYGASLLAAELMTSYEGEAGLSAATRLGRHLFTRTIASLGLSRPDNYPLIASTTAKFRLP